MSIYNDYMKSRRSILNIQPEKRAIRPMGGLLRKLGKAEGNQTARDMSVSNFRFATETALENERRDIRDASKDVAPALAIGGVNLGVKLYGEREKLIMAKMKERQDQLALTYLNAFTIELQKQINENRQIFEKYNTGLFDTEDNQSPDTTYEDMYE